MAMTDPSLWQRIAGFALDDTEAEHPYSAKLADEEGWSLSDARRVAEEYRRFLYLSQILSARPAPPEPLDAAWRTHLLYTRAYWQDLVPNALQKPLHRDPEETADPAAQKAFWRAARPAYAAEFGAPPPPDIWVNPRAPTMGGVIASLMILGIGGAMVAFLVMFLIGWVLGIDVGGPVNTGFEKVFTAIFLLGWTAAFFSPLWAWLVTRGQKRLRSSRRPRPGQIGIGITYSRS